MPAGFVAITISFVLPAVAILNHFYRYGALLIDSGLISFLICHHDPFTVRFPEVLGSQSFYSNHLTPLFIATSAVCRALPVTAPQFFAIYIGFCHAGLALAAFWAQISLPWGKKRPWLAALIAIGMALSGLALAVLRYPHFEMLIATCFALFMCAWLNGRRLLALICFVIGLCWREDAGFLYAGFILVWIWMLPAGSRRSDGIVGLALIGFIYSLAAHFWVRAAFPDQDALARVYLGSPPFAHVSIDFLKTRIFGFLFFRGYIVFPALCVTIWAALRRDMRLFGGYLACLPWLALNLLAVSPLAGTLSSYYGYPFIIAGFWPLLALRLSPEGGIRPWEVPIGMAAVIAASFTGFAYQHNPTRTSLAQDFRPPPSLGEQHRLAEAVALIGATRPALGHLIADPATISLDPDHFSAAEIMAPGADSGSVSTAFYFDPACYREDCAAVLKAQHFELTYAVGGTPLRIARHAPLDDPKWSRLLVSQSAD